MRTKKLMQKAGDIMYVAMLIGVVALLLSGIPEILEYIAQAAFATSVVAAIIFISTFLYRMIKWAYSLT